MYLVPKNAKAATQHLRATNLEQLAKNAERGNAHAQYHLGCMLHGEGELSDALYWFECAAEKAHPAAQLRLSQCYGHGHAVHANDENSLYWCKLSAAQHYAPALNDLGIKADSNAESAEAFRAAVSQQFGPAYFNLALCHQYGRSVPASYETAARLYRQSAEQGCVAGKFNLAVCQFLGQGVAQSVAGAVKEFRNGAGLGHAESQNNLGYCQYFGKGLKQNYEKAAECFRMAAAQGDFMGQYNLSCCFERGLGVAPNEAVALDLRAKAAASKAGREEKRSRKPGSRNVVTERNNPLDLPAIDRNDEEIDNGSMSTSIASRHTAITQRVLYFARGVADFEASPHMDDRSKFDDAAVRGVSLFSASSACTLKSVGARLPAKARAERAKAPENFLAVYDDDDDVSTSTGDDLSLGSSSTWASSATTERHAAEKRIALSPIPKGRSTLSKGGKGGKGDGLSDDEVDPDEDKEEMTVAYHNYFGPTARRNFYESFRKMNRLKDHYTAAQLEELREKRAIVKPRSGMPQPINPRDLFPPSRSESLESEESNTGGFVVDGKKEKSKALPELKGLAAVHAEKRKRAQQRKEREAGGGGGGGGGDDEKEYNFTRTRPAQRLKESLVVAKNLSPRSVFLQELLFCGGDGGKRDMVKLPRSILVVRRDSSVREINVSYNELV